MYTCPICGKYHVVTWPQFYVYRRGTTYYCSENCMFVGVTRDTQELNKAIRKRVNKKMAAKKVITELIADKSVQIALDGGDPRPFLAENGSRNPDSTWWRIRAELKELDPDKYNSLPDRIPRKKVEQVPTVKLSGPLKIETPEAEKVQIVETPEKPKKQEKKYTVTGIRTEQFGEFYYDKKFESIDWRTVEGDEVSLSPLGWKNLMEELPDILDALGVEL
jgi:hypothetical protein